VIVLVCGVIACEVDSLRCVLIVNACARGQIIKLNPGDRGRCSGCLDQDEAHGNAEYLPLPRTPLTPHYAPPSGMIEIQELVCLPYCSGHNKRHCFSLKVALKTIPHSICYTLLRNSCGKVANIVKTSWLPETCTRAPRLRAHLQRPIINTHTKERARSPGQKNGRPEGCLNLAWGVVAPRSQSGCGYAPSSRLAPYQLRERIIRCLQSRGADRRLRPASPAAPGGLRHYALECDSGSGWTRLAGRHSRLGRTLSNLLVSPLCIPAPHGLEPR
jgi:hypothetical protein